MNTKINHLCLAFIMAITPAAKATPAPTGYTINRMEQPLASFITYRQKKSNLSRVLNLLYVTGAVSLFLITAFSNAFSKPVLIVLGCLSIGLLLSILYLQSGKNKDAVNNLVRTGHIHFYSDHLTIAGERLQYSMICDLKLHYNGYPKTNTRKHLYDSGNFFEFEQAGRRHTTYFLVENEEQRLRLQALLITLYHLGLKVHETTNHGLSTFLHVALSYQEIQALKKNPG